MSKKGGRGGGHLQSKKFHCKFTQVNAYLRTFAKKKRNVISKNGEGGGSKAVWEFSKKTSSLGNPVTPKDEDNKVNEDDAEEDVIVTGDFGRSSCTSP